MLLQVRNYKILACFCLFFNFFFLLILFLSTPYSFRLSILIIWHGALLF